MPRNATEDGNGNITFQEKATDSDGNPMFVDRVELDQIGGTSQTGSARTPSWLSYTTTFNAGTPSELLIDLSLTISQLLGGTTYTFLVEVSDGIDSTQRTVDLDVETQPGGQLVVTNRESNYDKTETFALSTPFDISTIGSRVNAKKLLPHPGGMHFKPDGTKVYQLEGNNMGEWGLSTPFDISTATLITSKFLPQGKGINNNYNEVLHIEPSGNKITVTTVSGEGTIQYDMTTPWDLTSQTFVDGQDQGPLGIGLAYNNDGTKVFLGRNDEIFTSSLSVAYSVLNSSTSFTSRSIPGISGSTISGITFNSDGTRLYCTAMFDVYLYEYALSGPYDLSNIQLSDLVNQIDLSTFGDLTDPGDIAFI